MSRLGLLARRAARSPVLGAITTPYSPSRWTELLNPLWSVEDRAEVLDVRTETHDVLTITLRPAPGWPGHHAGQHTVLRVAVDGVRTARAFTVASSAHRTDTVELTCKAYPGAAVVPWVRDHLGPGDVVGLDHPTGDVHLPATRPDHLLCVTGGSGITPAMAMLRTLRDEGHQGRVTFVQLARTAEDVLFAEELVAATAQLPGLTVHTMLTREPGSAHEGRRLDEALLAEVAPDWREALSLVCGPVGMLTAAELLWRDAGAEDRLLVERFRPAPVVVPPDGATGTLRFARAGIEVPNDGTTILAQAEAAGLTPDNGCRMGICHTCDVPKLRGATKDVRDDAVDTGERDRIQPCVAVCLGDVEIDL